MEMQKKEDSKSRRPIKSRRPMEMGKGLREPINLGKEVGPFLC